MLKTAVLWWFDSFVIPPYTFFVFALLRHPTPLCLLGLDELPDVLASSLPVMLSLYPAPPVLYICKN